jgi:hypothetical protein
MTPTEELEVRRALKRALSVWPGRPDFDVYFSALERFDAEVAKTAVHELVCEWTYAQRPLPGDFRRRAVELASKRQVETRDGGDGYLRGADGRHIVMDEMATREAYRREFNHVPAGWSDEAMAEREALRNYYRHLSEKPMPERMRVLLEHLKRIMVIDKREQDSALHVVDDEAVA